jgi:CheY-like chemotaxis protein
MILIAEDNEDSRLMLRTFVESLGHRVTEAKNGRDAVEAVRLLRPDLILMDLNMPVLDGAAAVRYLRAQPDLRDIPILANSADGLRGIDLFSNFSSLGRAYLEYTAKPFNLQSLAEQIEIALASGGREVES